MATASTYKWTNAGATALRPWTGTQEQFSQMASLSLIQAAAKAAGNVIKLSAQDLIFQQPPINGEDGPDYTSVAERMSVWDDDHNTWVGVPEGDPELENAFAMDKVFPVLKVAFAQSEDAAGAVFEKTLVEGTF